MTTVCCGTFRDTPFCKLILARRSVTQFSQILGLIIWQSARIFRAPEVLIGEALGVTPSSSTTSP
jgi:hypothetical protein